MRVNNNSILPNAQYETGKMVTNIDKFIVDGITKIRVQYHDVANDKLAKGVGSANEGSAKKELFADLVIGADGPNSAVRRTFLGDTDVDRKYAGYLAWRGVVPEDEVSAETRNVFKENITYSILGPQGGHVIV